MAARRRGKGLSQRDMAARLGVSPQTVLALETRFAGRSETLARYLRILGLHAVLTVPSRRLVPPGNDAAPTWSTRRGIWPARSWTSCARICLACCWTRPAGDATPATT